MGYSFHGSRDAVVSGAVGWVQFPMEVRVFPAIAIGVAIGVAIVAAALVVMWRLYAGHTSRTRSHFQALFRDSEHSRGLFMAAFHASGQGRVAVGKNGEVLGVNRAVGELFGLEEKDFLRTPIAALWEAIAVGCAEQQDAVNRLSSLGRERERVALRTKKNAMLRVDCAPVRNVMREDMGLLFVFQDVTNEVLLERAREESLAECARKLSSSLPVLRDFLDELAVEMFDTNRRELVREISRHVSEVDHLTGRILELMRVEPAAVETRLQAVASAAKP